MKIFFIQKNKDLFIDPLQIEMRIRKEYFIKEKLNIKFSNDFGKVKDDLKEGDVVILGFDHRFNPDYVEKDILAQIKYLKHINAQIALCTEYRFFDPTERYFDKDTDCLQIHKLSFTYRLPLLDIYNFLNSWYLRSNEKELKENLEPAKDFENLFDLTGKAKERLFIKFISSWLYRRFIKRNRFEFFYGASLYPEVWDRKTNEEDINNFKKIGFNAVRVGEFFWSKLEPEENHYDMDYLRILLNKFKNNNIKVILGIPSPTPPRWFTLHYPEAKIVNRDGEIDEHGSRQHICTNNLIFRRKVYQLAYQISQVVNQFDNVVAIQLDNEYKCHVDQCFCPTCKRLWHRWLKEKYIYISSLNKAWGTDLWSERYPNFDSVVMPTKTPFEHNTALQNSFARFSADTLNDFASSVAQILIANTNVQLTHNTSMNFNLNNYELFNQLDIVGYDTYPRFNQYWNFPINLDLWRNLKDNPNFYLLETCTSHVGYIKNYVPPYPRGYLPTEIFLGYAAGLNSILFWPYRAQSHGVEQTHSAVVTQAGTPDLGYEDVLKGGQILNKIKPILKKTRCRKSKIAIIYSDSSKLYMNVESGGIYQYRSIFTEFYEAITRRGVSVELIHENDDFSKFKCLLVPFVRYVSDELLSKFKIFTEKGGKLILGPLTGDRTIDGNWHSNIDGLGKLGEWLGVKDVVQYLSSEKETKASVNVNRNKDYFNGLVTLFKTNNVLPGIKTKADVTGDRSIIYANKNVLYLGGMPENCMESPFWDYLVQKEIKPTNKSVITNMTDGIYKYERENEKYLYIFLANMLNKDGFVEINACHVTDDKNQSVSIGKHAMKPYSYRVFRLKKEEIKNGCYK